MLRSEFDEHPLWATTTAIGEAVASIRSENEAGEVPKLETVLFYANHAETFRELATINSALFSKGMLAAVNLQFEAALASLQQRLAHGVSQTAYVDSAAAQAEESLVPMAP